VAPVARSELELVEPVFERLSEDEFEFDNELDALLVRARKLFSYFPTPLLVRDQKEEVK
jgi:hypothetical protein